MNITIAHRDGPQQVDAVICGRYFGIHLSLGGSGHTVTHTPSGLAVRDGVSFRVAVRVAHRLVRLPLDWSGIDVAPFQDFARDHPWRLAWALGMVGRPVQRAWVRFAGRLRERFAPTATRLKDPIANMLDRREDTCWAELAMWTLHYCTLDSVAPWGFWGPQVAGCRRDARVNGSCYCGKFCNQTTALDLGWKPGDARPIIVTSELTALDDERRIYIGPA